MSSNALPSASQPLTPAHAALERLRQKLAERGPVAPAPQMHEQVAQCAKHGPWRQYRLDAQGVLRAAPGCPACLREVGLRDVGRESESPERFDSATFANYAANTSTQKLVVHKVREHARRLSDGERAGSLVLWGDSGTGKTHLANALLQQCQTSGLSVHYVRSITLMDRLRAARALTAGPDERRIAQRLASVDVLVIDDVGKSLGNDFERSGFFNIIDTRWGALKSTIVTTNEPPESLRDLLTPAGFDRLTEAGANVLHLNWPSHRRMRLAASMG